MSMSRSILKIAACAGWILSFRPCGQAEAAELDYNRDIRPILADNCFRCHGPDKAARKSGLRLDLREESVKLAKSGLAPVVPGQPDQSELLRRIFTLEQDDVMPPPDSHRSLSDAQKQMIKLWIEQGAPYAAHWAFVMPQRPQTPAVKMADWPKKPLDHFILRRLEQEGLAPSPAAEKTTLIRRVTLDLTGLPPTIADIDTFLADTSAEAYERVVDRLMSTRDYAERRAQDWLDLARYADTRGFADDKPHDIWPYREWLISAIQKNQPFDQFTIDQLAGDMLPDANNEQRIASAFHRNAPQAKGNTYPAEEYRLKGVVDRVNTTATVWLGLTVGCAECHDHKFDPISQVDYYRMFAIFNNIEHSGEGFAQGGPHLEITTADNKKLSAPVMKERSEPRETFVHLRGNFLTRGEKVLPRIPAFLGVPGDAQPANRLEFARWLVSGKNPLVARVAVNRFWQGFFGHGLVRTPADFGLQGEWPTHPQLLDWLACEFVSSGWDMKAMHRLIVTSSTYRQAARVPPQLVARDPQNRWLMCVPRVRLPAEQIRDQALAVSGLLKPAGPGPSVFPPQPDNYWEDRDLPGKWTTSTGDDLHRKSLYIYWRRMALHPTMELLDAPARAVCSARRNTSNLPTQALVTLNDPLFVEAASALAQRILTEVPQDDVARLDRSFQLCLGRRPDEQERERFLNFLAEQRTRYANDLPAAWTGVATVLLNLDETLTRP
jgi:cytochrome c553